MKYFFRLDFGIYSRYSKDFELKKIPNLEAQKEMIKIFFKPWSEVQELKERFWLTWFELEKLNN